MSENNYDSFAKVLQDQLMQDDPSKSYCGPAFESEPAYLAFLMGNLGLNNSGKQKRIQQTPYSAISKRPFSPLTLSPEQKNSMVWFQYRGCLNNSHFTRGELKTAFRTLAKQLHPDQNSQESAASDYQALRNHFNILNKIKFLR